MNVDIKNGGAGTVQSFLANWLQKEGKNGRDLVGCVSALGLNTPPASHRLNSGVQKMSTHWLVMTIFITAIPPQLQDLIWPMISDSPGPRFSHHVPA